MSEKNPSRIRYMKQTALEHERNIYKNYFYDLINNFGVDTVYFRHDTKFPEQLDLTPSLSGLENLINGENDNMTYYLSGDMIVYIEVDNDIFELSRMGLLPNENITIYFTVDDFNTRFATQLGKKKSFNDTITFSGTHSASTSADLVSVSGNFTASDIISGTISYEASAYEFSNPITGFTVDFNTSSGYQIPINPYIARTGYLTVSGGDYLGVAHGNVTIDLSAGTYSGSATVGILYYEPVSPSKYHTNIMPQVGDFFRMEFFDENHEEFEITNIANRIITTDGINPLLGKYIWKCSAVRRIPDANDEALGRDTEEGLIDELQNIQSYATEHISNDIVDYTDDNRDNIYGGYDNTDSPIVSSGLSVDDFTLSGKIFTFDFGPSYLYTDGFNLYFYNENDEIYMLSDDDHMTFTIPSGTVGINFLRTDEEDFYFVNTEQKWWKLSDNYDSDPYVNSLVDFNNVLAQDEDFIASGVFMTIGHGMHLFSDGQSLFAVNKDGESTQLSY